MTHLFIIFKTHVWSTFKARHSPCSQDDDLSPGRGHTHLHTGVAILSKLACQELVQLCLKDTVCDELREEDRVNSPTVQRRGNTGLNAENVSPDEESKDM